LKILHTADWHIGKVLHKHALRDELHLFFDWLIDLIREESIDVLLVSGDVFDLANPATKDRELYFAFLSRLIRLNIEVIITGGNHDGVGLLNAPKQILRELKITVIGGATENIEEELIEVKNKNGDLELVIAAVPFLRDKDLRSKETDELYENRTEAIREGIKKHYQDLAALCEKKYSEIPVIAMGHLFAKGSVQSESERDIHVGNAAAVDSKIFSSTFDYVALGHIHRPQVIGKNKFIRYSGSPIALSFSERADQKSLLVLELKKGKFKAPELIEIPKFRALHRVSGDFKTVKEKLSQLDLDFPLKSLVELDVKEQTYSAAILMEVEKLISTFEENESFSIVKSQTTFVEGARDTAALFKAGENIEDLEPIDVFSKLLEKQEIDGEKQGQLKDAFLELLESLN